MLKGGKRVGLLIFYHKTANKYKYMKNLEGRNIVLCGKNGSS